MISLRLLGPIEVSVDGAVPPAELLWRKNLALLVYLARSPRGRTREHLVGVLWPDKDDAKARHSLNEALRVLRRSLGTALLAEADTVRIERGAIDADTDRLEQLDPQTLGLRFLEGFTVPEAAGFEEWVAGEQRSVQSAQLKVLGTRMVQALAQGAPADARALALAALRLDPHHEASARLAMRAFALEGRRAQALEVFDKLKAALAEIGIEPDSATRQLVERIRTERIHPGRPPVTPDDVPSSPLAGQARAHLAQLSRVWEAVLGGAARTIVVLGDPGTGKTRIADEIAGRASLDGAVVVRARAAEGESARQLWAVLLRGGLDVPELAGAAPGVLAGLAALDPDIAIRFSSARGADPLPFGEALPAAIHAVADARPVLLVVDDAHRAPAEVLNGLATLVERSAGKRVCLLVLAARAAAAVDSLAERVGRDLPGAAVAMSPMTEAEIGELVQGGFPAFKEAQRTRLARRVFADTAGNPFLAVELVRAVRDGLNLPETTAGAWPAAKHTLDDTMPGDLPESVTAALRLRFRALSPLAQQVLAAAAVLGGWSSPDTLARATELARTDLDRALDELEWSRWMIGEARGYALVTRIAGEVVLADMVTGGQQRRIRERAAKA